MVVDALSYVMEYEQDMSDCYNSMSPQEKAFMDNNSMFNLHTDELGRRYYV
jgi:fructosamine-3-kinase